MSEENKVVDETISRKTDNATMPLVILELLRFSVDVDVDFNLAVIIHHTTC